MKINSLLLAISRTSILLLALLFSACATNEYKEFYESRNASEGAYIKHAYTKEKGIRLVESFDFSDVSTWESKGYCVLGSSSFRGKWVPRAFAIDCAEKDGASLVLVFAKYLDTKNVSQTVFIPTQSTTYHYGTVYTPSGSGSFYGTSTTPTVTPMNLNYEIQQWEQTAVFLAPLKDRPRFGVAFSFAANTPGIQNETVKIRVVYKGSPAENQGIKIGDVVKSINGTPICKRSDLQPFLNGSKPIESMEVERAN